MRSPREAGTEVQKDISLLGAAPLLLKNPCLLTPSKVPSAVPGRWWTLIYSFKQFTEPTYVPSTGDAGRVKTHTGLTFVELVF